MIGGNTRTLGVTDVEASDLVGLGLAGLVVAMGLLVRPPVSGDLRIQLVLTVFLATVIMWIFRPVPYAVSSLLCVTGLFALGLVDSFAAAVSGFASTLVFFFVLLLLVGQSISTVGLDGYVATRLVSATSSPRSSFRRLAGAILMLAFVMPSGLARTVTFMPVIDQINATFGLPEDSPFRRLGYYLIGHVNHLGSLALMTGGGMAIVTAELINASVRPLTWIEWAIYMAPPTVLLYVSTMAVAARIFALSTVSINDRGGRTVADEETARSSPDGGGSRPHPAPMNYEQRVVVLTLGSAIVLWVVGSFVGVPTILPAMLIVAVLALPGIDIITAESLAAINWGVIFLIGAMLSLLEVLQTTGALAFIIDGLLEVLPTSGHVLVVLPVLMAVAILVRGTFSAVSPALLVVLPILIEFAGPLGVNALFLSFSVVMILGSTTFLPFNVSTVLLAYEAGPLTLWEVFWLGMLTLLVAVGVVVLAWVVYWPAVDGLLTGVF